MSDSAENDTHSSINWTLIQTYESGKSRRYNLLFAVNGGTFAIVSFLISNPTNAPTIIATFTSFMCLAFIWFSVHMAQDIKAFGDVMRKLDRRTDKNRVFGEKGQLLLRQITLILVSAWVGLLLTGVLSLVGVANS